MSFGLKTETPAASRRNFRSFNLYSKTEVIFVGNLLYGLIALVSFGIAVWLFLKDRGVDKGPDASILPLVVAIILIVIGIIFGGLFLAGRVNKTEDIHITE